MVLSFYPAHIWLFHYAFCFLIVSDQIIEFRSLLYLVREFLSLWIYQSARRTTDFCQHVLLDGLRPEFVPQASTPSAGRAFHLNPTLNIGARFYI